MLGEMNLVAGNGLPQVLCKVILAHNRDVRSAKWNPVLNCTSLCGFANRRLNCSANGILNWLAALDFGRTWISVNT